LKAPDTFNTANIADTGIFPLEQILEKKEQIQSDLGGIPKLKGHFKQYLGCGYYPYFLEDTKTYHQKIVRVIQKTIYEDIANFYKLKTENLSSFKRILSYLATTPPGELNKNSIAKHIGLDSKTIHNYLEMLEETGMVERVSKNRSGTIRTMRFWSRMISFTAAGMKSRYTCSAFFIDRALPQIRQCFQITPMP
jgi:uncharacterized protein